MTDQPIQALSPEFSKHLKAFQDCFPDSGSLSQFHNYSRGLISDLPRKSVEPIALACGMKVRTLQVFLKDRPWDHTLLGERLRAILADHLDAMPNDLLSNVGVIDETSSVKKGKHTPGVQRQYLGCVGKTDNGIVTVHLSVSRGRFHTLLDADLFLPESWSKDRERCRQVDIPDELVHRPKWQIALEQLRRARACGIRFDWLTFDEGYGNCPEMLCQLSGMNQNFVAEIPVNFSVRRQAESDPMRVDAFLKESSEARRIVIERATSASQVWVTYSQQVVVRGRVMRVLRAVNEKTKEVKFFITNVFGEGLRMLLQVAFRRWTVEHCFRKAKTEMGLMHYEGRSYVGLIRHMLLTLLVMAFVAMQTSRLRGKKPAWTVEQMCRVLRELVRELFRRRRGTDDWSHCAEVVGYHQRRNEAAAAAHKRRREPEYGSAL